MKAVKYFSKDRKVELVDIPVPKITEPCDVLIKIAYSGICGTDLHIIEGKFPCTETEPLTLGHEFSGTIVETGENVTIFKKGDNVVVDPNNSCHCCTFCHTGKPHFCTGTNRNLGTFRNGAFAEYVVVPAHTVHKLPNTIPLRQGALAEPLSCISHGWDIISPVTVGSNILIMGAGIIGTLWVSILHVQGHRRVTVCEPNEARLAILKNLDTGFVLVTPEELKSIREKNSKHLFDIVIECSGYPPAIEQAISSLQRGGTLCCFGVAAPDAHIRLKPFDIFMKELKIFGVKVNPYSFPKAIGLLESMGERYLNYDKLGIKTFELKDYKEALEQLKKGSVLKAIFKMQ